MENSKKYDFVIIGSGAGGATVARELAKRGRQVLVVEKGVVAEKLGSAFGVVEYFDGIRFIKMPVKSKEGVILWHCSVAGGSTVFSCGEAFPPREGGSSRTMWCAPFGCRSFPRESTLWGRGVF